MANVIPHDFEYLEDLLLNEVRTLQRFKRELPDQIHVYHNVYWTKSFNSKSIFGEIDFILLTTDGIVLAIEQKDIKVVSEGNDLFAHYQSGKKNVTSQVLRNIGNLRTEYKSRNKNQDLYLDYLLYLPNSKVSSNLPSNIDKKNIVDSEQAEHICEYIEKHFENVRSDSKARKNDFYKVAQFFSQKIGVLPEIGVIGEELHLKTRRLADGLATWGSRLELSPHRLHVKGTAGSGKTQLAFSEIQKSVNDNKELLYVCYNRLLAESISKLVFSEFGYRPKNIHIFNIHQFANNVCEILGINLNKDEMDQGQFYDQMLHEFFANSDRIKETYDVLIIDEGQDFQKDWLTHLIKLAKPISRIFFMEDPSQSIYESDDNLLSREWPLIKSPVNYRSPRNITQLINNLSLLDNIVESGSFFGGFPLDIRVYKEKTLIDQTFLAISKLRADGFSLDKIVVLTFKRSGSSIFFNNENSRKKIDIQLKYYKGVNPIDDTPIFSEGNCRLETLYRFKGQAAAAIVITEVDLDELDEKNKKKLFVALTRARLAVSLVISNTANKIFSEKIGFEFQTLT